MTNKTLEELIALKTEWDNCSDRIKEIKEELKPLVIERLKQLNYKEEEVEIQVKVAPRKFEKKKVMRGFVSWNEDFKDADTGEMITIERNKIVMEDGEWFLGSFDIDTLINWNKQ